MQTGITQLRLAVTMVLCASGAAGAQMLVTGRGANYRTSAGASSVEHLNVTNLQSPLHFKSEVEGQNVPGTRSARASGQFTSAFTPSSLRILCIGDAMADGPDLVCGCSVSAISQMSDSISFSTSATTVWVRGRVSGQCAPSQSASLLMGHVRIQPVSPTAFVSGQGSQNGEFFRDFATPGPFWFCLSLAPGDYEFRSVGSYQATGNYPNSGSFDVRLELEPVSSPLAATPVSADLCAGASIVVRVPEGANAYQWRRNGSALSDGPTGTGSQISGAQTAILTIASAGPADVGQYAAAISTACGQVVSLPATLTIACYPNCDCSTVAPELNVADFTCFLQAFAAGTAYANCDGSTHPPALNVADFTCFLQRFAAGCP